MDKHSILLILLPVTFLLIVSPIAAKDLPKQKFFEGQCDCGGLELKHENTFDGYGLRCEYDLGGVGHSDSTFLMVSGFESTEIAETRFQSEINTYKSFPGNFCTGCEAVRNEQEMGTIDIFAHKPGYLEDSTFYFVRLVDLYAENAYVKVSFDLMVNESVTKEEVESFAKQLLACGRSAVDNAGSFPMEEAETTTLTLEIGGSPLNHLSAEIITANDVNTAYTDDEGKLEVPEEGEVTLRFTYHQDKDYYSLYVGRDDKPAELTLTMQEGKVTAATLHAYGKDHDITVDEQPIERFRLSQFKNQDDELLSTFYRYVYLSEALEAYQELGVEFKRPVKMYSYFNAACGACYDDQTIYIDSKKASYEHAYAAYFDYHEFSHYAMEELYGSETYNKMTQEKNHAGFANPTTADSWMEGYAAFMAQYIAITSGRASSLSNYPLIGSLDQEYLPWELQGLLEEAGVAGVLYDLIDDAEDTKEDILLYREPAAEAMLSLSDANNDGEVTKEEFARSMLWHLNNWEDKIDADGLRETLTDAGFTYDVKEWEKDSFEQEFERMLKEGLDLDRVIDAMTRGGTFFTFPVTKQSYLDAITKDVKDDDGFTMEFEDLWNIMAAPRKDFTEVYEALSAKHDVDDLFRMHGFYADNGKGNDAYDEGEAYLDANDNKRHDQGEDYVDYPTAGFSYDEGERVGTPSNYERTMRRSMQELPGMYLETSGTKQLKLAYLEPFTGEYYESYAQNEDGKAYVPLPAGDLVVIATDAEELTQQPLTLSSKTLAENMDLIATEGSIAAHDFGVKERKDREAWPWLLLIIIGGGLYLCVSKREHVKKHAKNAAKKTKQAYHQAKPHVIKAAKKTKEAVKKGYEQAKPHVKKAAQKTKQATKKLRGKIRQRISTHKKP